MRFLPFIFVFAACVPIEPTDTRGVCRDFEVCTVEDGQATECNQVTIWYECDPDNERDCEWRELDRDYIAPNDFTVPCEQCDVDQCLRT